MPGFSGPLSGIGYCVSNWDFPEDTYGLYWNRWKKGATTQKERSHYIRPDLFKQFLPSNVSKPFDYYHLFTEELIKGVAKMAVSALQPTQPGFSFPFSITSFMQSPMEPTIRILRLISKYSALEDTSAINV